MRRTPIILRAFSIALLAIAIGAFGASTGWRGRTFPGFFLMPNRVVASAGLPDWNGAADGRAVYQHVLLSVDGVPVADALEAYDRASRHALGDPVHYVFAHDGHVERRVFPLRLFTDRDFFATFGMYFLTGLAFLVLAALTAVRWRLGEPYRGLAAFAATSALYLFTALDLYSPGHLFRIHVIAEACLPAAAMHFALGCAPARTRTRGDLLPLIYGIGVVLTAAYEVLLYEPSAYTAVHDLCQALAGLPVFLLVGMLVFATPHPALGTRGARQLVAATLVGLVLPATILALSGVTGGRVPVNAAAWFGILFPLGCVRAFRLIRVPWRVDRPVPAAS